MSTTPSPPVCNPAGFFHRPSLVALGRASSAAFAAATPFPHAVFDDFLPGTLFEALAAAFPPPSHPGWKRRDHPEQAARLGRLERTNFDGVAPALRHLLAEFCGMAFLDFLEALSGQPGLLADPHFTGGGLASTLPGGHLAMHVDFNRDRRRDVSRVLTALLYLHPTWERDWGGALRLARDGHRTTELEVRPNRLIVIENRDDGFHGHPEPLRAPEGHPRQVLLAYYYRVGVDVGPARSAVFRTDAG